MTIPTRPVSLLGATLLFGATFFACGGPPPGAAATAAAPATSATQPADQASVHFYKGKVSTTSPDGKTPYGMPTDTVVRRTIDPKSATIVEDVVSAGREFPTTMRRIGTTSAFEASDESSSFTGTITFAGPEWQWDSWTYTIVLSDKSGSISGTGRITSGTITTEKVFTRADGRPSARIAEELAPSTSEEFEREKSRLLALPRPSRH